MYSNAVLLCFSDQTPALSHLQHLHWITHHRYWCNGGEKTPLETKFVTSSECFLIPRFQFTCPSSMSVFPTFSFPSFHSITAPEEPTWSVHFKTHFSHTSGKERGRLALLIIYSSLPTWGRRGNWRLLKLVGLHCCKWRHHLAQDHANSSLWTAFGRKQKSALKDRLLPLH